MPEEYHGEIRNFGISRMLKKWESPQFEEDLPCFSRENLLEVFKALDFEALFSAELTSNHFDPCGLNKIQLEVSQAHAGPPAGAAMGSLGTSLLLPPAPESTQAATDHCSFGCSCPGKRHGNT